VPWNADAAVLVFVHAVLFGLLIYAISRVCRSTRSGGVNLTVKRGEKSMNFLHIFYGVASVVLALLTQVADAAKGYKAGIIFADYMVLTYLCFFNCWFRNTIFRLYCQIQED